MEQCETEGCSGVVFKQHLCLVCANKLFDTATSSDELVKEIDEYFDSRSEHAGFDPWEMVALLRKCKAALQGSDSK